MGAVPSRSGPTKARPSLSSEGVSLRTREDVEKDKRGRSPTLCCRKWIKVGLQVTGQRESPGGQVPSPLPHLCPSTTAINTQCPWQWHLRWTSQHQHSALFFRCPLGLGGGGPRTAPLSRELSGRFSRPARGAGPEIRHFFVIFFLCQKVPLVKTIQMRLYFSLLGYQFVESQRSAESQWPRSFSKREGRWSSGRGSSRNW